TDAGRRCKRCPERTIGVITREIFYKNLEILNERNSGRTGFTRIGCCLCCRWRSSGTDGRNRSAGVSGRLPADFLLPAVASAEQGSERTQKSRLWSGQG